MGYYYNLDTGFVLKKETSLADAIRVIRKYDHGVNFVLGDAGDLVSETTLAGGDRLEFVYSFHDECGYAWASLLDHAIAGIAAELADFTQGVVEITSGDNLCQTWFVGPRKEVVKAVRKTLREAIAECKKRIATISRRKGGKVMTSYGDAVVLRP